ncbi:gamma-glutamyl kinase [Sedimentitalea sp. XS_ASV28]|uniref:gamma-glutamyl kinase n=1 Tax=Sedimentitalea sp. XS_ASV28 TaxID=3241296 RepID=UPI0035128075
MLVFHKERLAFLAIPKTGTTAYHAALSQRADIVVSHPTGLKHASVNRYGRFFKPMFANVGGAEMELLAVMREPISWLGSWYRYRQRDYLRDTERSTRGMSFDEFVLAYMRGNRPAFAAVGSQAKFLRAHPNGTAITHLFRYEELPRLDRFLEERLGIEIQLTRENVSPEMALDLSPEVERKYRRKCHEEFQLYESIG